MDLGSIKNAIVTNVYLIESSKKVAKHKHTHNDEVFYCLSGKGYGVLGNSEVELSVGKTFIVPAGVMHSLRTDSELCIASFLIPIIER